MCVDCLRQYVWRCSIACLRVIAKRSIKVESATVLVVVLLLLTAGNRVSAACDESLVSLQVLGSGGPFGGIGHASAGYLVWIDGVGRIMVDAGGGTFARFREVGGRVEDLDLLALSHFHPDHSSEVPALLWPQRALIRIAGPSGSDQYPSVEEFVSGLFTAQDAVFRVVSSRIEFETVSVDVSAPQAVDVFSNDRVVIRGVGVPHGDVPTVGYRVDIGDASIGFSSDQLATSRAFVELVEGVDVLVVHFAASENAVGGTSALHASPSAWGRMASAANVKSVLLSHLSQSEPSDPRYRSHSGSDRERSIASLREQYAGPVTVADDLMCVPIF